MLNSKHGSLNFQKKLRKPRRKINTYIYIYISLLYWNKESKKTHVLQKRKLCFYPFIIKEKSQMKSGKDSFCLEVEGTLGLRSFFFSGPFYFTSFILQLVYEKWYEYVIYIFWKCGNLYTSELRCHTASSNNSRQLLILNYMIKKISLNCLTCCLLIRSIKFHVPKFTLTKVNK